MRTPSFNCTRVCVCFLNIIVLRMKWKTNFFELKLMNSTISFGLRIQNFPPNRQTQQWYQIDLLKNLTIIELPIPRYFDWSRKLYVSLQYQTFVSAWISGQPLSLLHAWAIRYTLIHYSQIYSVNQNSLSIVLDFCLVKFD